MSNKSDGVQDMVKWLEKRCKERKADVEKAEANVRALGHFDDCGDFYHEQLQIAKALLDEVVQIKISTEKYMKLLRHQGE